MELAVQELLQMIGLTEEIKGRTVVVVEDIVDTGVTLEKAFLYAFNKKK